MRYRRVQSVVILGFLIAALVAAQGCSKKASTEPATGTVTVTIKDLRFNPKKVVIKEGATVRWVNEDTTAHTSTSADFDPEAKTNPPDAWDSPVLNPGQSFSRTFDTKGTFDYACSIHGYIKGTVEVE